MQDTLETCLNLAVKYKLHRLYVVDKNGKPIKCINLEDILRNSLFQE